MNRHLLYLAMRYLMHHRRRTFLLWLGLSITCLLPLGVHHLTKMFEARLRSRAEQTPLLLGVRGNDYDLVLHALYFRNVLLPLRVPRTAESFHDVALTQNAIRA